MAIRLAFGNYRALVSAVVVVLAPTFVIGGAALGYWWANSATRLNPTGAARLAELTGLVVLVLGNLLAQAAGAQVATSVAVGRPADWRRSRQVAAARAGAAVTVSIEVGVLCSLGLVLFILPGVYLWISWLVVMPVVVLEGCSGREALSRSSYLVKGRWWSVFGGYLMVELFLVIWAIVASTAIGFVFHGSSASQTVVEQLASVFIELALSPIVVMFVVIAYLDLRLGKEGISPADVAREAEFVSGAAGEGATPTGLWWGGDTVGDTPSWQTPAHPSSGPAPGPSWPAATPYEAPDTRDRQGKPAGWPAPSPKPPAPGDAAPHRDASTPGDIGPPSDETPGTAEDS